MPRFPRPLVDAIFISAPDRFEVGPDDHFEVGKVYPMRKSSLERWIGLGRARAATPEEIASATGAPVAAEPPPPPVVPAPDDPAPVTAADPGDGEAGDTKPPDTGDKSAAAAALLAALEAEPRMNFMAFTSKAREILGDVMPAKKVEIVAALKALAEAPAAPAPETPPAA